MTGDPAVRVAFFTSASRSVDQRREAVAQDIALLSRHTQATEIHLAPPDRIRRFIPERLYGLHRLASLRQLARHSDVFHIFHPHPRLFTFLSMIQTPMIYTITAGLRKHAPPPHPEQFNALAGMLVASDADAQIAAGWGIRNVNVIRPGIDTRRFTRTAAPTLAAGAPFYVLLASAPWTLDGFRTKGIHALLNAAERLPWLHLRLIWRDILTQEIHSAIAARGLQDRVEVVNAYVNMNDELSRVHAAALLTSDTSIIKAYPNSLMEAQCCGRPVIMSGEIPLADDVQRLHSGIVVKGVDDAALVAGLEQLRERYADYADAAARVPHDFFDQQAWLQAHLAMYQRIRSDRMVSARA